MRDGSQRPREKWRKNGLPLPSLLFFGSRFISRAVKTENPLPRSFFAPKPNGNACSAGQKAGYFIGIREDQNVRLIDRCRSKEIPNALLTNFKTPSFGQAGNRTWTFCFEVWQAITLTSQSAVVKICKHIQCQALSGRFSVSLSSYTLQVSRRVSLESINAAGEVCTMFLMLLKRWKR